jgi:Protein of unknown function (DUF1588)/Protein of unknown function (DUF1585)
MNTHGCTILVLGTALATVACSGSTYQVGSDPGSGGSNASGATSSGATSSGATGSGATSSGGSSADGGTTAQAGAAVGGGSIVDPPAAPRCGFAPASAAGPGIGATTDVVLERIELFLDGSTDQPPPTNLPAQATPELAAALATAILDDHLASKTEAPGLARFLKAWLKLSLDPGVETEAANTWALKLLDPKATLSTLLAEPTGEPHRIGILTDPQVLSARPLIPQRGAWIQENLFCKAVPPPPVGVPNTDPSTVKGVTRREKLETVVSAPACNACHALLDPPGDSLEHFDAMGNYRDTDAGAAVDSSASITSPMAVSFDSFEDLAPVLATSCAVAQCFTGAVMKDAFTVNKLAFTDSDVNQVANTFAEGDFSIRDLVTAIVSSPAFLR